MPASLGFLSKAKTAFLLCDIQEKFLPRISSPQSVLWVANCLVKASTILKVPLLATEQYPKGLGKTAAALPLPEGTKVFEKTKFSMWTPEVEAEVRKMTEVTDIVVFGIETHVCVLQTVMDLLRAGYNVHIPADGVSSIRHSDRMVALDTMRQLGALVSTSESILFRLLGDFTDPSAKEISALVKGERPDSGLCVSPPL
eukprot:RCo013374